MWLALHIGNNLEFAITQLLREDSCLTLRNQTLTEANRIHICTQCFSIVSMCFVQVCFAFIYPTVHHAAGIIINTSISSTFSVSISDICTIFSTAFKQLTAYALNLGTSQGARMSRAPTSHSGRSGNPKISGLSLEPAGLKHDQVKPMTLTLILVAS